MRYFFHIIDDGRVIPDEEGSECFSLDAAKAEARASARDLALQAIHRGDSPDSICVEIHDRGGRVLGAITVEEVLQHPRRPAFDPACMQPDQPRH